MIRQLRKRFLWTTMAVLTIFLAVVLVLLNFLFSTLGYQQNISLLQQVARNEMLTDATTLDFLENDHQMAEIMKGGSEANPVFVMTLTDDLEVDQVALLVGSEGDVLPEITTEMLSEIYSSTRGSGNMGDLFYALSRRPTGAVLAVMDTSGSTESSLTNRLWLLSLALGCACLFLLYPICRFLSRFVTKSTEESFAQQKQFISDAGHELKTPLSIISVNANVLSTQVEENKHLTYIQSEVQRMNSLITQLIALARMEDRQPKDKALPVSLSDLLYQVALPFEGLAFERGIDYEIDIADEVNCLGYADQLRQLVAILLDNAFKYTRGRVNITLEQSSQHIHLEVYNTGDPIPEADLPRIFERFYRCDRSRASANGYGLGLAIAQSIVETHRGSISVENLARQGNQGVLFRVSL